MHPIRCIPSARISALMLHTYRTATVYPNIPTGQQHHKSSPFTHTSIANTNRSRCVHTTQVHQPSITIAPVDATIQTDINDSGAIVDTDKHTGIDIDNDAKLGVVELGSKSALELIGDKVYMSPFSTTLQRVKRLSFISCVLSVISAPTMVILSPPHVPLQGTLSMASVVVAFGIGTTYALNKFSSGYITTIYTYKQNDNRVIVTTYTITGGTRYRSIPLSKLSSTPYDAKVPVMSNVFINLPNHSQHNLFVHDHIIQFQPFKQLFRVSDDDITEQSAHSDHAETQKRDTR